MWVCPYRVVIPHVSCWPDWHSCRLLGLVGSRCEWVLSCLGSQLKTALSVDGKKCCRPPAQWWWFDRWILSKECPIFFRCNWTAESWPQELCHSLIEGLFSFTYVQICVILALLSSINYITLLMPGCFILRVEKLPPQCVTGFEVNRDVVFIENLEFLRYSCYIRNVKTMFYHSLPLCLLWIWIQGLNPATTHKLVWTKEASYMWGETSSRNWNKFSCLSYCAQNDHDLQDWESSPMFCILR